MSNLIKYEAACRALAEAKQVDEVKDLRDKAEAMRVYAMQAQNKSLEVDAAEIRIRAERRLGEMISEQKATAGLSVGGRPQKPLVGNEGFSEEVQSLPTTAPKLADAGISYDLSSRAQKLAAVPQPEFEAEVAGWRERVQQEGQRVTTRLEAAGERAQKRKPAKPDNSLMYQGEDLSSAMDMSIDDILADMDALEKEKAALEERIKALTADDLGKELDNQVRITQGIEARLGQEMDRANLFNQELRGYGKWFADLRKVLNMPTATRTEITAAVRELVNQQQEAF